MLERNSSPLALAGLLALSALVLGACAGPAAVPTEPATSTAAPATLMTPPPTNAAAAESTEFAIGQLAVPATSIRLASPSHFAFDADGNLYVSACTDTTDNAPQLYKIDPYGLLTVYAGPIFGNAAGDGGPALCATMACAEGLAFDRDGNLYVADSNNHRIRRIDRNGFISTVVGSGPTDGDGSFAGEGGPALAARLNYPSDIAIDADGNLYIDDFGNNRIRKVDLQGVITTVAIPGEAGFTGDGAPATAAQLHTSGFGGSGNYPGNMGITGDVAGNIYVSDSANYRVRKIDPNGIIATIAGTGQTGYSGDGGPAIAAQLSLPTYLAIDADGNLYISDNPTGVEDSNRIRKVDKNGIITTVAGAGQRGDAVDGGPATLAALRSPAGLAFDSEGSLYIVDRENRRVRKVDQAGIITTVVGGGS